jgi:bifunctional enzyme CysN/CysC
MAVAGQSVTLTLTDEIDCSRGDVIAAADSPPEAADQFEATLVWMAEEPLLPGRPYWLKIGARLVSAQVLDLKHKVNVNTLEHLAATTLELNEIAVATVSLDQAVAFEPYETNPDLGGFILIDRLNNATVGAGMIRFALRRSHNIHWQALDVSKDSRAKQKGQKPAVLWFTGLSGAGKSTIANVVEKKLQAQGRHTYLLDGDNVRHGLNRDLGFTDADRVENIRRVAEVARLMADAGLIVLVSFISPFRAERDMARRMMGEGEFFEVFVDTPLAVAEERDVKGLYKKARAGELKNFTGIDSPYEAPESPRDPDRGAQSGTRGGSNSGSLEGAGDSRLIRRAASPPPPRSAVPLPHKGGGDKPIFSFYLLPLYGGGGPAKLVEGVRAPC